MSYNSPQTSLDITGVTLSQDLLDQAQSIIHLHTDYRWAATSRTEHFSGDGLQRRFYLRAPVISITSVTLDDVPLVVTTEYTLRSRTGRLTLLSPCTTGDENLVVAYSFGYDDSDESYRAVLSAEARLALFLKKNPTLSDSLSWKAFKASYNSNSHVAAILAIVPVTFPYTAV